MSDEGLTKIPKAELHVHIEGTLRPAMVRRLAARNGLTIDPLLFTEDGNGYRYDTFLDLVTYTYHTAAKCMQTAEDYADVVHDYLTRCAAENSVYEELIAYPGQRMVSGIAYADMVNGIVAGIDQARAETGIEAGISMAFERHRTVRDAEEDADIILSCPHPRIVSLDLAGGEQDGDIPQFLPPIRRVLNNYPTPLGFNPHAGENSGCRNIRVALDAGATRLRHAVRVIEDPGLVREVAARGIVLEICLTSNLLLMPQYKGDLHNHPLRRLFDAGVKVTLNADDPGLFGPHCTLGGEYGLARDIFGFTDAELCALTRNALEGAYLSPAVRNGLLVRAGLKNRNDGTGWVQGMVP